MTDVRIAMLALCGALVTTGAPFALHRAFPDAPPPAHTGGFGEPTCVACHFGDANDPRGSLVVSAPEFYTPGATYEIRVRLKHPELMAGGFEISFRDSRGLQAGRFVKDTASVGATSINDVIYLHHRRASTRPAGDSIVWTFDWIAPERIGDVSIHAAANATNDDQSPLGDYVYTRTVIVHDSDMQ